MCRGFLITVLDAVIRFELVYGLELTQIPKDMLQEVNVCQLKGLRQVLKSYPTLHDGSKTNPRLLGLANQQKNPKGIPGENIEE